MAKSLSKLHRLLGAPDKPGTHLPAKQSQEKQLANVKAATPLVKPVPHPLKPSCMEIDDVTGITVDSIGKVHVQVIANITIESLSKLSIAQMRGIRVIS